MRLIDFLLRWYDHRTINSFYKKGQISVNGVAKSKTSEVVIGDVVTIGTSYLIVKESDDTDSD